MSDSIISNYEKICEDNDIDSKEVIKYQLQEINKKRKKNINLNGNQDKAFEDRIYNKDIFILSSLVHQIGNPQSFKMNSIDLRNNRIDDDGIKDLINLLRNQPSIVEIRLGFNKITSKGVKVLCQSLESGCDINMLDLSDNDIGEEGTNYICQWLQSESVKVKRLLLNNTNINESCLIHIFSTLGINETLEVLEIERPLIRQQTTETMLHLIKALETNQSLFHLNLGKHDLQDETLDLLLQGLLENRRITYLNLSGNKLTNLGAKKLANFLKNKNCKLEYLNLRSNRIEDKGAIVIAKAIKDNFTLVTLDIQFNAIDPRNLSKVEEHFDLNRPFNLKDLRTKQWN
eukprot:gb/GECH01010468.1/.p1 GENE.gb/GECH01010468.1/~~gb/GECH01010468.1/.p1  ORF type:complete len:345 (+),score=75.43 gb/GECH01010468.1/:1-1035(+)